MLLLGVTNQVIKIIYYQIICHKIFHFNKIKFQK